MALAYRLHKLGVLSEWGYRDICITLAKLGYRSGEPEGIERETSTVLAKVFTALWTKRLTKADIADDLGVPQHEIEALVFGLTGQATPPDREAKLTVVSDHGPLFDFQS